MLRRWPTALGVVFAASLAAAYWFGFAEWERLAEVLAAAGLVYLGAAALGLRSLAWPMFSIAFVLITIGFLIPGFTPFWWMVGIGVALVVVGLARGAVRPTWGLPLTAGVMLVIAVIVLTAMGLDRPWAAVLVALGLLAHAAWDVYHHRTGRVVVPSMAEFCAVLDALLGLGILVAAFVR